jgi:hypothetical protein
LTLTLTLTCCQRDILTLAHDHLGLKDKSWGKPKSSVEKEGGEEEGGGGKEEEEGEREEEEEEEGEGEGEEEEKGGREGGDGGWV